jgi:hypothetical protein
MAGRRRRGLQFETEISWFVLVSILDIVLTWLALRFSAEGQTTRPIVESNPVAQWVLVRWGIQGLAVFKLAMTALVVAIAEFVGRSRPQTARLLLIGGILVVGAVVVYTVRLLFTHR